MARILITYDLSTPPGRHTQVKANMVRRGYHSTWNNQGSTTTYDMPNTCLMHDNTTQAQAIADLKQAVAQEGARLEMVVAAEITWFLAEQVNPRG